MRLFPPFIVSTAYSSVRPVRKLIHRNINIAKHNRFSFSQLIYRYHQSRLTAAGIPPGKNDFHQLSPHITIYGGNTVAVPGVQRNTQFPHSLLSLDQNPLLISHVAYNTTETGKGK
jgi:hypothetical protein